MGRETIAVDSQQRPQMLVTELLGRLAPRCGSFSALQGVGDSQEKGMGAWLPMRGIKGEHRLWGVPVLRQVRVGTERDAVWTKFNTQVTH